MSTHTPEQNIERLENYYVFECEGGPLRNCTEWIALKQQVADLTAQVAQFQQEKEMALKCCEPGCEADADFIVFATNRRDPDNEIHACLAHLGAQLGTTVGFPEAPSWLVYPVAHPTQESSR